jgi:hypothetical protein
MSFLLKKISANVFKNLTKKNHKVIHQDVFNLRKMTGFYEKETPGSGRWFRFPGVSQRRIFN